MKIESIYKTHAALKLFAFLAIYAITSQMAYASESAPGSHSEDGFENYILIFDSNNYDRLFSFDECEVKPQFAGGQEAFQKYLKTNARIPEPIKENAIQGKVTVSFVVDKHGNIKNVKVKQGVNSLLDAEAVRLISSMPKWNPGKAKGRCVDVKLERPLSFVK